jgi:hypothetical protein
LRLVEADLCRVAELPPIIAPSLGSAVRIAGMIAQDAGSRSRAAMRWIRGEPPYTRSSSGYMKCSSFARRARLGLAATRIPEADVGLLAPMPGGATVLIGVGGPTTAGVTNRDAERL